MDAINNTVMNVAEYAKALSRLPMNFKVLPYDQKIECYHSGVLFMAKQDEMIQYVKGEWHPVLFINPNVEIENPNG